VTCRAGGSTRERTHATIERILAETDLVPAAHLTCVGATRAEVSEVVRRYWAAGVRHIVALRGDPPGGLGISTTSRIPKAISMPPISWAASGAAVDAEITVSAYPEKHPDSPTVEADLDMLAIKVDAGATVPSPVLFR
jgi:methylenetetrahydrofolate reductase (NADPH)